MKKLTRDDTEHGKEYYLASDVDALMAQPEQTTGNILMDSYKAMQSMKVEGPRHVVCQCDKCKAQPEQEPCDMGVACAGCSLRNEDGSCPYAKPEQAPSSVQQAYAMAQVCLDLHDALGCKWGDNVYLTISKLKAAAQPEQEPVALEDFIKWDEDIDPIGEVVGFIEDSSYIMVKVHDGKQVSLNDDLYTTSPQRPWVGLTFAEICECESEYLNVFARAIEAKLKEKNNAA